MNHEQTVTAAKKIIAAARHILGMEDVVPYIYDHVCALSPVPIEGLYEDMGAPMGVTEGWVMYYDPAWVVAPGKGIKGNDPIAIIAGALFHELQHPLRGMYRLEALPDRTLANKAGDLAINPDILLVPALDLPEWVLLPKNYGAPDHKALEFYYDFLEKKSKEKQKKECKGQDGKPGDDKQKAQKGKGGSGKEEGTAAKQQGAGEPSKDTGKSSTPGSGQGSKPEKKPDKIGAGGCGGCANNPVRAEFEKQLDEQYGRDKADQEIVIQETFNKIKEHVEQHGRGSVPGELLQNIEFQSRPKPLNWKRTLRTVLSRLTGQIKSGMADYSMRRPSKRSIVRGVLRPGLIEKKPEIAFIEDTSGSMGDEQIIQARNQTIAILKQLGVDRAWHLQADYNLARPPKRVSVRNIPNLHTYGRGGTSFKPALEAVEKVRPRPDLVVYLTDGDGDAPDKPPRGIKVVWVIVPTSYGRVPAPWGHIVVVSEDQKLMERYRH